MRVNETAQSARDGDEPRFCEPWEAQAFALVLALHEARLFAWSEWTAALSREIHAQPESGPVEGGGAYYRQWLAALESPALPAQDTTASESIVPSSSRMDESHEREPPAPQRRHERA